MKRKKYLTQYDNTPIFPISSVSKITGISPRMIREYEKYGFILPRKINGRRIFSYCEVLFLKDIEYYIKNKKMGISGAIYFYIYTPCWGIKKCNQKDCKAYKKYSFNCWNIPQQDSKCNQELCNRCPIFLIKNKYRKENNIPLKSPIIY